MAHTDRTDKPTRSDDLDERAPTGVARRDHEDDPEAYKAPEKGADSERVGAYAPDPDPTDPDVDLDPFDPERSVARDPSRAADPEELAEEDVLEVMSDDDLRAMEGPDA